VEVSTGTSVKVGRDVGPWVAVSIGRIAVGDGVLAIKVGVNHWAVAVISTGVIYP